MCESSCDYYTRTCTCSYRCNVHVHVCKSMLISKHVELDPAFPPSLSTCTCTFLIALTGLMITSGKCLDKLYKYITICTELRDFDRTLGNFVRILSGVRLLS